MYRYHLLKYKDPSSRLTCPNCGKPHSFSPYVDEYDHIVGESYGRCNHESSCGYHKYPPYSISSGLAKTQTYHIQRVQTGKSAPKEEISLIPIDIVRSTIRTTPESDFVHFLRKYFDGDVITRLIDDYQIGVTKSKDVIFYQFDFQGRCRTGKIMKYDPETGHRIKEPTNCPITWVHSVLKREMKLSNNWNVCQCVFGEHLLAKYPEKPIILVEAEKTAIIGSGFCPKYVWLAVGGKSQLGEKLNVLNGKKVTVIPDLDAIEAWKDAFKKKPLINTSVVDLSEYYRDIDLPENADIADIIIEYLHNCLK